tara:strand:+ start:6942 stop:7289 length:348 start_codon:yes stop_codon:yes gene_type:complete
MPFKIIINHLAGIILLIICKGNGILEIGNINPDNNITGSISPIKETIIAVCCVEDMVEIRIPSDRAFTINKVLSAPNKNILPCTGILKTKMLKRIITVAFIMESKMYGTTFPTIT